MDFLIFMGLFIFFSCLGFLSLRHNEKIEQEKSFERLNPILGKPMLTTEPHVVEKNKSIKYTEPVTASVIVSQPLSNVLKNRWAHFFHSKKYYKKEFNKASKLAVIKMQKTATDAHLIVNTRVQTSVLRSGNILEADKICAVAYGTAITYY
jgi:uncharacterized protein YbjQ (UPF0145 family)